tara:strand:+ start:100277 stop:101185 length:909 start_codon:yes stop_codon:yes gene_type:complete
MTKKFYSNGKLLLTGEYGVLDGALALAVPTRYGQSLIRTQNTTKKIVWKSFDHQSKIWFEALFDSTTLKIISSTDSQIAETLQKIVLEAQKLNTSFLSENVGYEVNTFLDFPRDWGLGSSSTLLNNVAQWAEVNPFTLLWNAFTGSGYDIACAQHNKPITYQVLEKKPLVTEVAFTPHFLDAIYFIHLNTKQNSREGINSYRKAAFDSQRFISKITSLTNEIRSCKNIDLFKQLILAHEALVGAVLQKTPIQQERFSDFNGAIKSLGAWGGDFIMAVGDKNTPRYFQGKGYATVLPYAEMVL